MDSFGTFPDHPHEFDDEINGVQARHIWGYGIFFTKGEGSTPNSHKPSSIAYFETETSIQQPKCYENNLVSSYHLPPSLMPPIIGLDDYDGIMNYAWIRNYINNQHKTNVFLKSLIVREILKKMDNCDRIEKLLVALQGCYTKVIIDKEGLCLFQKLLEKCRDHHLYIIVEDIESCRQSFIDAALNKGTLKIYTIDFYLFHCLTYCVVFDRAIAMIMLIERLKKTDHAFTVTRILSSRLVQMMTHVIACVVIQHCFTSLGCQPNKILYTKVMHHFHDLAVHKVGCRSLYVAIDTVSGEPRTKLLNHIANSSVYLSNDPYGNYIVQYVLSLNDQYISTRIVMNLKGRFIELSQSPGGSRVVENCMESSKYAAFVVVSEIIDSPKALVLLAHDNYGNYVIQKALMKTQEHGLKVLYDFLVKSLRPYRATFDRMLGLRNLAKLLK